MTSNWAAKSASTILGIVAGVHVYWAVINRDRLGAFVPSGKDGRPLFRPTSRDCMAVAVLLFGMSWLLHKHAEAATPATRFLTRTISLLFTLRAVGEFRYLGFFKSIRGSIFARLDSALFSPLCAAIGMLSFLASLDTN